MCPTFITCVWFFGPRLPKLLQAQKFQHWYNSTFSWYRASKLCIYPCQWFGLFGSSIQKCPCGSNTVKLRNSPLREYSKNVGNSWTFSKIWFDILHYNGIVRLIIYGKQSSSLKKWLETIHYIFQSWLLLFLLHSNAKRIWLQMDEIRKSDQETSNEN